MVFTVQMPNQQIVGTQDSKIMLQPDRFDHTKPYSVSPVKIVGMYKKDS